MCLGVVFSSEKHVCGITLSLWWYSDLTVAQLAEHCASIAKVVHSIAKGCQV